MMIPVWIIPVMMIPVWMIPVWMIPVWMIPVWMIPVWTIPIWIAISVQYLNAKRCHTMCHIIQKSKPYIITIVLIIQTSEDHINPI
jgi:hypothetical protein